MLTLWKSLVMPILDYCSQLWSPSKVGEIQQRGNTEGIHAENQVQHKERLLGEAETSPPLLLTEKEGTLPNNLCLENA